MLKFFTRVVIFFVSETEGKSNKQENLPCKAQQAYVPPELEHCGLYMK